MQEISQFLSSLVNGLSGWEACAVVLAIAYLLLAAKESIYCWYCALVSTAIYTFLFWDVSLLMESALNVYYMVMAVYGWHQWRYGGKEHSGIPIRTLDSSQHLVIIGAVIIISLISGLLLSQHTDAAWPYVDSFTTWGSVITTVMVAKKILENWLYWLVIDSVSIPLYIDRGLYLTAILFMVYIVIIVVGYLSWRQRYNSQQALANA
jgi:nicotinamide mononucleotide transporter